MNYDMVEFIKSFCSLVTLYLSSLLITIENYYFFAERTYNLQGTTHATPKCLSNILYRVM
jgi:hypothetical protein